MATVLTMIQQLLGDPNADDGLMADITQHYRDNREGFNLRARQLTLQHAITQRDSTSAPSSSSDAAANAVTSSNATANEETKDNCHATTSTSASATTVTTASSASTPTRTSSVTAAGASTSASSTSISSHHKRALEQTAGEIEQTESEQAKKKLKTTNTDSATVSDAASDAPSSSASSSAEKQ